MGTFINEIAEYFLSASPKIYQLALRRGEEVVLTFPEEVISSARRNSSGSIIAAALQGNLTDAEVWNCLGTTVLNLDGETSVLSLRQASNFYTAAKCFARDSRNFDQKYCFNFIRCNATMLALSGECPSDFFVRDTAFYLGRSDAALFNFHSECLTPFFELVRKFWSSISPETRAHVVNVIHGRRWVHKSCQAARDILALAP